ncbi:MAG: alpha/beta hydrolase [Lachnospiraceae bacterium]|nr:alpha/beta hydrolase [Lachnospiraceae bacterium]
MKKTRRMIIEENEISQIYTFPLGGIQQKVLIEGKRKELPVVICLHGGPGTPIPFSVGCRGLFPEFTEHFIMVYWDQLGCGINDYMLEDKFNISSFVEMTRDLIEEVKKLFPNNKIILFGISWGSVLALKASKYVDAVVVYGQVMRKLFLNDEVFGELEKAGLSKNKMDIVKRLTPDNFNDKDMQLLSGSIRKYTNGYNNEAGRKAPMGAIIRGLLTSPDYSFKDFKAIMINGTASSTCLWKELLSIDLTKELSKVEVPYHILQGDTDIVTSTSDIVRLVSTVDNSYLHCYIVEDSGHEPGVLGMEEVFQMLFKVAASE